MDKKIKLSTWAKLNGYSYRCAYNLFKQGFIQGEQLPSSTILITTKDDKVKKEEITIVYAIVSSNEVKGDEEDLLQDFVSIVTSLCARIYGKRRSRRMTKQLIEGLKGD